MSDSKAAPVEPQGAETNAAQPDEGAVQEIGTPEIDRGDFDARLMNDPGFAAAEYKKAQQALSRLQNETRTFRDKYAAIDPLVDFLGGPEATKQHLAVLGTIRGSEAMSRAVDEMVRTGRVPMAGATDPQLDATDEYLDPAERKIKELEQRLAQYEDRTSRNESRGAQEKFRSQVSEFFGEYPELGPEDQSQIIGLIDRQIQQWDQTPEGRQTIASLNKESVAILAGKYLVQRQKLEEIGERAYRRKLEQKQRATTEVAAPVQSNGRAMSPQATSAKAALREFMRNNGLTEFGPSQ